MRILNFALRLLIIFTYGFFCDYIGHQAGKQQACEQIYTKWYQKLDVKNIDAKAVTEGCEREMK
jgi:hypothetical protein